jgi:hypothetical protein
MLFLHASVHLNITLRTGSVFLLPDFAHPASESILLKWNIGRMPLEWQADV